MNKAASFYARWYNGGWMDEKVSDGWRYRWGNEEQRERVQDERRRSNSRSRYASDYQPVSDAVETDKEEEEWTRASQ